MGSPPPAPTPTEKKLAWTLMFTAAILVVTAIALVRAGFIYGKNSITVAMTIAAGVFLLGAALAYQTLRNQENSTGSGPPVEEVRYTFVGGASDWLTRLTALAGVFLVVTTTVQFFAPPTPPHVAFESCPNARTWNSSYIGITFVEEGTNTRSGPSRSYAANSRFPGGCSVGFDGYCIGDPLTDGAASDAEGVEWVNARWLRVVRYRDSLGSTAAWLLSGEESEDRYVADVLVNPAEPFADVPFLGNECPLPTTPEPGAVTLSPLDSGTTDNPLQLLQARASYAPNIGFAVWYPPTQPFVRKDYYEQIFNPSGKTADNPGKTTVDGVKTATWPYHVTSQRNLDLLTAGPNAVGTAYVMAVPCLSDNVPSSDTLAAIDAYAVRAGVVPERLEPSPLPGELDRLRLAQVACQAQI